MKIDVQKFIERVSDGYHIGEHETRDQFDERIEGIINDMSNLELLQQLEWLLDD